MPETSVPESEISQRISCLQLALGRSDFDGAFITELISLYYYTGTMQSSVLFVPARGDVLLFVRRSVERARLESPLPEIIAFKSYREMAPVLSDKGLGTGQIGIDERAISLSGFKLLTRHFPNTRFADISTVLSKLRAVKSPFEIEKMKKAGEVSRTISARVPDMLEPGISEWGLALRLYHEVALEGNMCISRISANSGEFFFGNVCFSDSANFPTLFDGPGGLPGKSAGCPHLGSDRKLKKEDLAFIDLIFPFEEYYVDKTRIYSLGKPSQQVIDQHAVCLEIQESVKERLKPGAVPAEIYETVFRDIVRPKSFEDHFMGFGSNQVKFLGHGIGLVINEYPVIAKKFEEPLEENMVLAVEPKKGIEGIGMVGIENTYRVTSGGGECLTEDSDEITVV
jgi:Xaa-Pro aminopeptidase